MTPLLSRRWTKPCCIVRAARALLRQQRVARRTMLYSRGIAAAAIAPIWAALGRDGRTAPARASEPDGAAPLDSAGRRMRRPYMSDASRLQGDASWLQAGET